MSGEVLTLACPHCRRRLQQLGSMWACPHCFKCYYTFDEWRQAWEKHLKPQEAM